jgi:molecular chaperone GrpE
MENKKDKSQAVDIVFDEKEVKQNQGVMEESDKNARHDDSDYKEMLQRLQADFNNYRRRSEKEKEELAHVVRGNLISQLLPVLDDFERLFRSVPNNEEVKKGAQLIYNNLLSVFKQFGLKSFTDDRKPFDPNIHEALSVRQTTHENDGKILETWQKGYWLKDKLLRPAKVIVGQCRIENNQSSE